MFNLMEIFINKLISKYLSIPLFLFQWLCVIFVKNKYKMSFKQASDKTMIIFLNIFCNFLNKYKKYLKYKSQKERLQKMNSDLKELQKDYNNKYNR